MVSRMRTGLVAGFVGLSSVTIAVAFTPLNSLSDNNESPFPSAYAAGFRVEVAPPMPPGDALLDPKFPQTWPFSARRDFSRMDESNDKAFYAQPRFNYHIDDGAISAIQQYLAHELKPTDTVLDVCSSWISHLPTDFQTSGQIIGMGMNRAELERNPVLTSFHVKDLNGPDEESSNFPLPDSSVDVVVCHVSIDYLIHPLRVAREMRRVLRAGGRVMLFFSNRFFPTKVVRVWREANEAGRVWVAGSYLHFAGFEDVNAAQLKTSERDPMYVVFGTKSIAGGSGLLEASRFGNEAAQHKREDMGFR
mmetsp:Transcript_46228/g.88229  ORF Transcript_46228/g.88229 Transcript_46228/m.88229 type:complete len:306 (+) Transcript_46228:127-1044(+)